MGEHPYIGQTVDGYLIEDLLGQGGMASVYRGLETSLGRPVAIKILPADALGDEDLLKRFEREARLIAQVNHPNIAQVYRTGMIGDCPYYAMEYIDGHSLADLLLERDRLTPMQAINYMTQTAKGLNAAAEHQIIHRDIKPANIMLTRDGTIKLVDFGIAKAHRDDTFKTMAGLILGTPRYMSPEQGRGLQLDFRSDMYSLGATFYHMLAGVPPFDSDNPITLVMKHAKDPVQAIEQFNDRVPAALANAIYTTLAKHPDERFMDYSQLITALENVYKDKQEQRPVLHAERPDAFATEEKSGNKKLLLTGAAVVVVLLLLTPLLFKSSDEETAEAADPEPYSIVSDRDPKPDLPTTIRTLREINEFRKELRADERED